MKRFLLKVFLLIIFAGMVLMIVPRASAAGCYIPQGQTLCVSGTPPPNAAYVLNPTTDCSSIPDSMALCSVQGCCCFPVANPPSNIGYIFQGSAYCKHVVNGNFYTTQQYLNPSSCAAYCAGTTANFFSVSGTVLGKTGTLQPNVEVRVEGVPLSPTLTNAQGSYKFENLVGGVSYTLRASLADCKGVKSTGPLYSSLTNFQISLDDCCVYSCPDWANIQCIGGSKTRTCTTATAGCTARQETIACSLPACDWSCTAWNPPDATCMPNTVQTRDCVKIPAGWPATQCQGEPPVPLLSKDCPQSQTQTCGNGNPDNGEMCDFGPNNQGFSYCIPDTPVNCLNCACKETPQDTDCIVDPIGDPNAWTFNVLDVYRERAFQLSWTARCKDFIQSYEITRCKVGSGQEIPCTTGSVPVVSNLAKTVVNYKHISGVAPTNPAHPALAIIANTTYCYNITVKFNSSVPPDKRIYKMGMCENSGQEKCIAGQNPVKWCDSGNVTGCNSASPSINEFTHEKCSVNTYCSSTGSNAQCSNQEDCGKCNSVLWMFGQQGYPLVGSDGEPFECPGLSMRYIENSGCFMDYSYTVADMTYNCDAMQSCYDYKSENACNNTFTGLDICKKFVVNGTKNGCEWKSFSKDVNKGVCRPKDIKDHHCDLCSNPKYNRIYPGCTEDVCRLYGYCYYNSSISPTVSIPKSPCINGTRIVCGSYKNSEECTGVPPDAYNVSVDVVYNSAGNRLAGTNILLKASNDKMGVGRCLWNNTGKCIRDADGNKGRDCTMGDPNDSMRIICERDVKPPNTSYVNQSSYGQMMDLSEMSIEDNVEWAISDSINEPDARSRRGIWLHYCLAYDDHIVTGGGNGGELTVAETCYPSEVLVTANLIADRNYKVNLSTYPEVPIKFRYFSEDPAKNLEKIKEFVFMLDKTPPNMRLQLGFNSFPTQTIYPPDSQQYLWYTDLSVQITLQSLDNSMPVDCYFTLSREQGDPTIANPQPEILMNRDIPNLANPQNTITLPGRSLQTSYPGLSPGIYKYNMLCKDKVGNEYLLEDVRIPIDGDVTIDDAKPFNITTPFRSSQLPQTMSVNTSVNGSCRYSRTAITYPSMTDTFTSITNVSSLSIEKYLHTVPMSTVLRNNINTGGNTGINGGLLNSGMMGGGIESGAGESGDIGTSVYRTGVYRYYIACNLFINNQWKAVSGSLGDIIDFAIDETPPRTTLLMKNSTDEWAPYVYNSSQVNYTYSFMFKCNDSQIELSDNLTDPDNSGQFIIRDRAFGCQKTSWCLKQYSSDIRPATCVYDETYVPGDIVVIDYIAQPELRQLYGNRPLLCYHSTDNGGNKAEDICTRINIQSTLFDEPIITVIDPTAPVTPPTPP